MCAYTYTNMPEFITWSIGKVDTHILEFQVTNFQGKALVTPTAGSSAAGVGLTTDDYRQPAGITDENSYFLLILWRESFFSEKKFVSKKW